MEKVHSQSTSMEKLECSGSVAGCRGRSSWDRISKAVGWTLSVFSREFRPVAFIRLLAPSTCAMWSSNTLADTHSFSSLCCSPISVPRETPERPPRTVDRAGTGDLLWTDHGAKNLAWIKRRSLPNNRACVAFLSLLCAVSGVRGLLNAFSTGGGWFVWDI